MSADDELVRGRGRLGRPTVATRSKRARRDQRLTQDGLVVHLHGLAMALLLGRSGVALVRRCRLALHGLDRDIAFWVRNAVPSAPMVARFPRRA